jgi:hypothetical protein
VLGARVSQAKLFVIYIEFRKVIFTGFGKLKNHQKNHKKLVKIVAKKSKTGVAIMA